MKKAISTFAFMFFLTACASSVQLAPSNDDLEAKRFTPVAGQSVVYVIQNGGIGSHRVLFQVMLNGQYVAGLSGNTYSRLIINPGRYRMLITTPENQESINFEVGAGDVLYLGARSMTGWSAFRVEPIQRLSVQEGKKAVQESMMAASVNP